MCGCAVLKEWKFVVLLGGNVPSSGFKGVEIGDFAGMKCAIVQF